MARRGDYEHGLIRYGELAEINGFPLGELWQPDNIWWQDRYYFRNACINTFIETQENHLGQVLPKVWNTLKQFSEWDDKDWPRFTSDHADLLVPLDCLKVYYCTAQPDVSA